MGDVALDVACLLLNRFCTATHHDQDDDHSEEWREAAQNLDAPPDRAHPAALRRPVSLPSRLRACTSARSLLLKANARGNGEQQTTVFPISM